MEIVPIRAHALPASQRCAIRAQRLASVKFVCLPIDGAPGVALRGQRAPGRVARFLTRVIGRLAAARP